MTILTRKLIKEFVEARKLVIEPFNEETGLQPASYDLSIGRYLLLGPFEKEVSGRAVDLEKEPGKVAKLKSGQFGAILTKEYLSLPLNVCARFGIKSKFAR